MGSVYASSAGSFFESAALAIFLPIAWQLLLLRSLARAQPDEPTALVLTTSQCEGLRAAVPALELPARPTVAPALRAVAYLGGHFTKRGCRLARLGSRDGVAAPRDARRM